MTGYTIYCCALTCTTVEHLCLFVGKIWKALGTFWNRSKHEFTISLWGGSRVVIRTDGIYERTLISRVIVQLFTAGKPQFVNHQSHATPGRGQTGYHVVPSLLWAVHRTDIYISSSARVHAVNGQCEQGGELDQKFNCLLWVTFSER